MSGSNRLSGLKASTKPTAPEDIRKVDMVGESRGFVDRTPRKKPGRKPSPRTMQLHPKVLPDIGDRIVEEAERLGMTQGQFIEHLWRQYENQAHTE